MSSRCWVIVDMTHGFATDRLRELAGRIYTEASGDPVYALVQTNPPRGPFHKLLGWNKCTEDGDQELLEPLGDLDPQIFEKTGYGALTPLPVEELSHFDEVVVVGADTDACVLATALALFDAGVGVVVSTTLTLSSGGEDFHHAALKILRRQLGTDRVR